MQRYYVLAMSFFRSCPSVYMYPYPTNERTKSLPFSLTTNWTFNNFNVFALSAP